MKPGDMLILLDDDEKCPFPQSARRYIGQECTLIKFHDSTLIRVMFGDCKFMDGSLLQFRRKGEHPRELVLTWDSCVWMPKREKRQ